MTNEPVSLDNMSEHDRGFVAGVDQALTAIANAEELVLRDIPKLKRAGAVTAFDSIRATLTYLRLTAHPR